MPPSERPKSQAPKSRKPPARKARKTASIEGGAPPLPAQPTPYGFQKRAIDKCRRLLAQGANIVLASPTGSGKTVIAGHTIAGIAPEDVISVSHSNPLCDQLEERLCRSFTIQGMLAGHVPERKPKLIVWDECHHSEAEEWKTLHELYPKAQLMGLTPCPQRGDGKALTLYDEIVIAAHYSELLAEGIIVPCKVSGPDHFEMDKEPDPVKAYLQVAAGKKGIFFLRDTKTADDVAKDLKRRKIACESYHSHMTKTQRKELFSKFAGGEVTVIASCFALSEGIDVPDAEVAVLAQRCTTQAQYVNTVGRILRQAPGKRYAHLLDLTGASRRHGRPTDDREYSLEGSGCRLKDEREQYDRSEYGEREALPTYEAKLVTWHDWKWPTQDDKRRNLAWLRQQAGEHGFSEEQAAQAFQMLFGSPAGAGA